MNHDHNVFIFLVSAAILISLYLIIKNEVINKNKENFIVNFEKLEQQDIPFSPQDINIYRILETPIAGAAGISRSNDSNIPSIGFKPEEVENLDVKIISENGIEYVDNSSLVPYLHYQIKFLSKLVETMQEQFSDLLNDIQNAN